MICSGSGMEYAETLVYLVAEDTLSQLHRGWPEGMRAALCLGEEGDCEVVLFHRDELGGIVARIATDLSRDDADFIVVPLTGGYPTRRIRFAEEQQLCDFVSASPGLAEMAMDYALNFAFLRDEGLDAGGTKGAATAGGASWRDEVDGVDAAAEGPQLAIPSGPECTFHLGFLEISSDICRLTLGERGAKKQPGSRIGASKVLAGAEAGSAFFVLPDGDGCRLEAGDCIELASDMLPEPMLRGITQKGQSVAVAATSQGVFLCPRHATKAPVSRRKSAFLGRPALVGALGLIALAVVNSPVLAAIGW